MARLTRFVGLGILGLVLVVGVGISGDTKKGPKKPSIPTGWGALKLSKVQRDKVIMIATEYDVKIRALETKIADLKSERRAEQVKVLTDAQKATLLKGLTGESKEKSSPKSK